MGAILIYSTGSQNIGQLRDQVSSLQEQLSRIQTENNSYFVGDNFSLSVLYEEVKDSVVSIRGIVEQDTITGTQLGQVQGSGFVYNYEGQMIVATNFHVVDDTISITVTFRNGNAYLSHVFGSDAYADLAILSVDAPDGEFKPIEMVSSSTLKVGDPVVAVGNPFGLTGSMTVGIVSQLGRTLREETIGAYSIADIIQTSAQINPGNSGGPLLNYLGQVVGITTAIKGNAQGLGFAIPSNMILREIGPLIEIGSYTKHSWLGASGTDMDYEIAKDIDTDITYGWLVSYVLSGGPSGRAGLHGGTQTVETPTGTITVGGDIIIAVDGARIVNGDDLLTYLAEHTLPGDIIELTVVRNDQTIIIPVELGMRPSPPT